MEEDDGLLESVESIEEEEAFDHAAYARDMEEDDVWRAPVERRQTRFIDDAPRVHETLVGPGQLTPGRADDNIRACCALGRTLLLSPPVVLTQAQYWMTHYTRFELAERDWFAVLVRDVLYEPLRLHLVGDEGASMTLPASSAVTAPPALLLRLVGSELCRVPLSHYVPTLDDDDDQVDDDTAMLFQALGHLLQTQSRCFTRRNNEGLNGELELGAFVYDALLLEFWEPSFHVYTLYWLHLVALRHGTQGQCTGDWLPRHTHSLRAVRHDDVDWVRCGDVLQDPEALARLQHDLLALTQALDHVDVGRALRAVQTLWEQKAEWCDAEQERRTRAVLARL